MCRLSVTARSSEMIAHITTTILLLTITQVHISCLTINQLGNEIVAKTKLELKAISIDAYLNDVMRISAPIINDDAVYYLHKPNGDATKLDITSPKLRPVETDREALPLIARFSNHLTKPILTQIDNYDIFSLHRKYNDFDKKVKALEQNEFMIGPLTVHDHGNWVLSMYTKDLNGYWVELFQVITVTITDYAPLNLLKPTCYVGDSLNLKFEYPIPNLVSCEVVAPRSTFDRFYVRSQVDMNSCGFTIPNITKTDVGLWKIIAVGNIVYEGDAILTVVSSTTDKKTTTQTTTFTPYLPNNLIKFDAGEYFVFD